LYPEGKPPHYFREKGKVFAEYNRNFGAEASGELYKFMGLAHFRTGGE
jgi:hypothetical protein